jgi:hypothetical protein
MSKALNSYMSITDGGPYGLNEVLFFKDRKNEKKPGMNVLSSHKTSIQNINFRKGSLGGIDWKAFFEKNTSTETFPFTNLDTLALEHMKSFLEKYGIDFDLLIEHKLSRTFKRGGFFNKAHYGFLIYDDEKTNTFSQKDFVIRGFNSKKKHLYEFVYPVYTIFYLLLEKQPQEIFYERKNEINSYNTLKFVGLNQWKESFIQSKKNEYTSTMHGPDGNELLSEDTYIDSKQFRLNNTNFFIMD